MLLTFKNIRNEAGKGNDVFNQSTKTLVDMSRAMGTDPQQAAIQLGKALNDPSRASPPCPASVSRSRAAEDADQSDGRLGQHDGCPEGHPRRTEQRVRRVRCRVPGDVPRADVPDARRVGDFGEKIATAALPALTLLVGATARVVNWATNSGIIEAPRDDRVAFTTARTAVTGFFTSFASGGGGQVAGFFRDMAAALGPLIPAIVSAVTAFSPLRIAFTALAPVIPVITLALTQLGSALGQGLAAAVTAIAPGSWHSRTASSRSSSPCCRHPRWCRRSRPGS
jgi:hypothetical protein